MISPAWSAIVVLTAPSDLFLLPRLPTAAGAWLPPGGGGPAPAAIITLPSLPPAIAISICEGLAAINAAWLARSAAPTLEAAAPRPRSDPGAPETWLSAPWLLAGLGPADCKALSAWRVAELRLRGEPATFLLDGLIDDRGVVAYHVRVRRAGGLVEDPQRALRERWT